MLGLALEPIRLSIIDNVFVKIAQSYRMAIPSLQRDYISVYLIFVLCPIVDIDFVGETFFKDKNNISAVIYTTILTAGNTN